MNEQQEFLKVEAQKVFTAQALDLLQKLPPIEVARIFSGTAVAVIQSVYDRRSASDFFRELAELIDQQHDEIPN